MNRDLDIYARYQQEEVYLITTGEFKRHIQNLDLPEPVEEKLIELGVELRRALDEQENPNTRFAISIGAVIAVMVPVVAVVIVAYWNQVRDTWTNSRPAFDLYLGQSLTEYTFERMEEQVQAELEAEGDSGAEITSDDVDWDVGDNLKHHVANGSNGSHRDPWKKFGLDPDDPNFYTTVLPFLKKVVDEGTKYREQIVPEGKVLYYIKDFAEKGQEIIVKIFLNNDGTIKTLSDAYVNTK